MLASMVLMPARSLLECRRILLRSFPALDLGIWFHRSKKLILNLNLWSRALGEGEQDYGISN